MNDLAYAEFVNDSGLYDVVPMKTRKAIAFSFFTFHNPATHAKAVEIVCQKVAPRLRVAVGIFMARMINAGNADALNALMDAHPDEHKMFVAIIERLIQDEGMII